MKLTSIFLVLMLAVAGSALAQTAPADTAVTASAVGAYPAGTVYNGVPLSGLTIASGALIAGDGSTADGRVTIELLGVETPLGKQVITVQAMITGGSRGAGNVATITGTCSINMGDGTPTLTGLPIVATITTDATNQGSVGLVLAGTTLPSATIGDGTMTVEDLAQ